MELNFDIAALTAETILDDELLSEVFSEDDAVYMTRALLALEDRARQLGVKTKFDALIRAYKQERKRFNAEQKQMQMTAGSNNYTHFGNDKYPELFCGSWIADMNGVRCVDNSGAPHIACYHPIMPIEVLTNVENNGQKVTLAFCKNGRWSRVTVPKSIVCNNNKITALADLGIGVTSDTARYLVRFLADVENAALVNGDIPERLSTAKMGWIDGKFMPYSCEYEFDAENQFRDNYRAITKRGKRDKWFNLVSHIRKEGRTEPRAVMAAAFASIIVKLCGALPFWFSLWGESGSGKTVCLMLAASIFADPCNYKYIADCRQTNVSMELRASFYNNLPLMLDDSATVKEKYGDDFSELIYSLASGKGKGRATRDLGLRSEETWCNTILITGERPLSNENLQGGAVNRVLDYEMKPGQVFASGQSVVSCIAQNYGFAGEEFVEAVEEIGTDKIRQMQADILADIQSRSEDKLEKQSISLSILLTADRIATDYIFKDGIYLSYDDVEQVLVDRSDMSENERCYEYILGEIAINEAKFGLNSYGDRPVESWGEFKQDEEGNEYVLMFSNVFNAACKRGGYSAKAFLNWAVKQGIVRGEGGRNTVARRFGKSAVRCVYMKMRNADAVVTDNEELPV